MKPHTSISRLRDDPCNKHLLIKDDEGGKEKNVWMAWSSCSIWQKKWEQVALLLNDEAVYILKFTDMSSSNRVMIEDEKITYSLY